MTAGRTAVRVYSSLVRLYPSRFRGEYGADMVQLVRDQCRDEPAWKVCGRAALDLAITIPIQHMEAHMTRNADHLVTIFYTALAGAGVLLAIVGGTNTTMLIVGLCITIVAGAMAAIAWRRNGPPRSSVRTSEGWWKFVLAGPCIVVSVIVAAEMGVDAWFVGIACVLAGLVFTGIGLVLGVTRLMSRRTPTMQT